MTQFPNRFALGSAAGLMALALVAGPLAAAPKPAPKPKPKPAPVQKAPLGRAYVTMETDKGTMELELFTKESPLTAGNFQKLVKQGFYDGIMFHRVVPGFVIQAGDPLSKNAQPGDPGLGRGGPGWTIPLEGSATRLQHLDGSLSMARRQDPNSAGSQFFICLGPQPALDGQYAVFGRVSKGMDVAQRIEVGDRIKRAYMKPTAPTAKKPTKAAAKSSKPAAKSSKPAAKRKQ